MKKPYRPPVMKEMCATCPFRDGSPYAELATHLAGEAMTSGSRICHSTGSNAINGQARPALPWCQRRATELLP